MDIKDIAWSAGIFEGEGDVNCTSYEHSAGYTYSRIQARVTSTDKDVLERLKALWGGTIYKSDRYDDRRKDHYKDLFRWRIITRQAREFLMTILVELGERRRKQIKKVFRSRGRIG